MADIRRATIADIEPILTMQRQIHAEHLAWDTTRWSTAQPMDGAYRGWLEHLMSNKDGGLALVASIAGQASGYLIAEVEEESTRHWSPRTIYLHDLFVIPESRRRGIARELMDQFLEWASQRHPWLAIRLITAARNDSARAFFQRLGFNASAVEMLREPI